LPPKAALRYVLPDPQPDAHEEALRRGFNLAIATFT
jgi:hypothetical protein